jgi:uncharacterized protein with NRDE domain
MCLITFAWQQHADFTLALCANRDEFYDRPTQSAQRWHDHPQIFAGRDLKAGGTWMGIADSGRVAAITNVRDPAQNNPAATSRGELVANFLTSQHSALAYCRQLSPQSDRFNGFNLLLCDGHELVYFSNVTRHAQVLEPGLYALSNAFLDTVWPKTQSARQRLQDWLNAPGDAASLATLLNDSEPAADDELPDTGVPIELEKALSSQFIRLDHYGTRSSTGFLVHANGDAEVHEINYDQGNVAGAAQHAWRSFWPPSSIWSE